jgi:hypothetical protein
MDGQIPGAPGFAAARAFEHAARPSSCGGDSRACRGRGIGIAHNMLGSLLTGRMLDASPTPATVSANLRFQAIAM